MVLRLVPPVCFCNTLSRYTGRCSMNTRRLCCELQGFEYSSDDYSDDLPYVTFRALRFCIGERLQVLLVSRRQDCSHAPRHPVHAGLQRYALCDAAGLQQRRSVLHLSQRHIRLPFARGRGGVSQDDVGRAALQAGRQARARSCAAAILGLRCKFRQAGEAPPPLC
jgi:hypothetical protein